jgi:hypothetical protein
MRKTWIGMVRGVAVVLCVSASLPTRADDKPTIRSGTGIDVKKTIPSKDDNQPLPTVEWESVVSPYKSRPGGTSSGRLCGGR